MSYKLLVIVGPTSSGKSELAVQLARRFNGEIISADSRQVYKGMNLGTGKVIGKWHTAFFDGRQKMQYRYKSIVHHLIDFVNPNQQYSAALFQRDAKKVITDIAARGKLPILCGGTGHWIDAVVYNQQIPDVKPNLKLRRKLEKKSASDLYQQLKKLDLRRAKSIDRFNKRRLIRALEIIISTGKPVPPAPLLPWRGEMSPSGDREVEPTQNYKALWLGIHLPQPLLFTKIKTRLKQRLKAGMIKEVQKLHRQGLSWKKLESFGLEYKFVSLYLQKKISYDEMFDQLFIAIKKYSKRQLTWWKKNKNIHRIKNPLAAKNLAINFLKNN